MAVQCAQQAAEINALNNLYGTRTHVKASSNYHAQHNELQLAGADHYNRRAVIPSFESPCQHPNQNVSPMDFVHSTESLVQNHNRTSINNAGDVVFLVGKRRQPYHVGSESLIRGSAYFRRLLAAGAPATCESQGNCQYSDRPQLQFQHANGVVSPIVIDCEEGVFQNLLLLLRYGTLEALPPLSAMEAFKLRREAHFYGIQFTDRANSGGEGHSPAMSSEDQYSDGATTTTTGSASSSPGGSPKRAGGGTRTLSGRFGNHVNCYTSTRQLSELTGFPVDLMDPAKLVLVSCLDSNKLASIYTCDCCATTGSSRTQWALSFHYRHAFCTGCGKVPHNMQAKHFAEMFMAAAAQYYVTPLSPDKTPITSMWWVGSDSACTLRFVSSPADEACSCGCSSTSSESDQIWATNSFYSHAFCTLCGTAAHGSLLLSLLLAIRYGKRARSSDRPAHGRC